MGKTSQIGDLPQEEESLVEVEGKREKTLCQWQGQIGTG
jgi:hypothetical protein